MSSQYNVSSISDLIEICNTPSLNHDVIRLKRIKQSLIALDKMYGMHELKQQIVDQVLYYVQKLNTDQMMHTALMGPPGVGKTSIARIIANLYKELGFLSKGKLVTVTREDLVGKYLGETAVKTRKVLDNNKGNVLFIDEAYSLGSTSHEDSYAKECIDTITAFLSENTRDFVCIIAGYPAQLKECFFNANPGLDRRFPWKYELNKYNG